MKYLVAVSGGVDSVVLLDVLAREGHDLIVAHFDHGIRPESDADARFVRALAEKYNVPSELRREELGAAASEERARIRRYRFLHSMAEKHQATLATAHHLDDVVESIAINMVRGTGWRGLTVMGNESIERPLRGRTKEEIKSYALTRGLEWVEDETNLSDDYLRNRIRRTIYKRLSLAERIALIELHHKQRALRQEIDSHVPSHMSYSRYDLTMMPQSVADEVLRAQSRGLLTRPQRAALLLAIKTAWPGVTMTVGNGVIARFNIRDFIVEIPQ